MAALNAIEFPETAGQTVDVDFRLSVCKDGSIRPELVDGTGPQRVRTELLERLAKTTVPPPPPAVATKMKSHCAKLGYTFKWMGNAIR